MASLAQADKQAKRYDGIVMTAKGKELVEAERDAAADRALAKKRHVWTPDAAIKSHYTGLYAPCSICHRAFQSTPTAAPVKQSAQYNARYTYFADNHEIDRG